MDPHTSTKSAGLICQEVTLLRGEIGDNMDEICSIHPSPWDFVYNSPPPKKKKNGLQQALLHIPKSLDQSGIQKLIVNYFNSEIIDSTETPRDRSENDSSHIYCCLTDGLISMILHAQGLLNTRYQNTMT